ncbi:hypothetical protein ACS0TY_007081 [Phlomoides rotata]
MANCHQNSHCIGGGKLLKFAFEFNLASTLEMPLIADENSGRFLTTSTKNNNGGTNAIDKEQRVFVAAALKISQPFPADTTHIYQYDDEAHNSFPPSHFLRWLEKAAIILPDASLEDQVRNRRWRLCSFEEVEAAKFLVLVIPS